MPFFLVEINNDDLFEKYKIFNLNNEDDFINSALAFLTLYYDKKKSGSETSSSLSNSGNLSINTNFFIFLIFLILLNEIIFLITIKI